MGFWPRAVIWTIMGLFLAYDLYLWGGLAVTPTTGIHLRQQASVQSPIAASYLFLGRHVVVAAGMADQAMAFAAERFPQQVADTQSSPITIVSRFLAAQKAPGKLAYYGAPLLFLLSLALHARRQKRIRSFGTKG